MRNAREYFSFIIGRFIAFIANAQAQEASLKNKSILSNYLNRGKKKSLEERTLSEANDGGGRK
jgi:hypothetical protein